MDLCKEQHLTSIQVSNWIRVLGFILGLPRSIGSRFSPVEGFNLPLNTHREFSRQFVGMELSVEG